jgi:hypothetical protein
MKQYLTNIPTIISQINENYMVTYCQDDISGTCIYQKYEPLSKFQRGDILQMTECNMSDIITYINEKSPLNEGDLINLQFEIREDSLTKLKHYISSGSVSDT